MAAAAGYRRLDYNWQWYRVPAFLVGYENGELTCGLLLEGFWITKKISSAPKRFTPQRGGRFV